MEGQEGPGASSPSIVANGSAQNGGSTPSVLQPHPPGTSSSSSRSPQPPPSQRPQQAPARPSQAVLAAVAARAAEAAAANNGAGGGGGVASPSVPSGVSPQPPSQPATNGTYRPNVPGPSSSAGVGAPQQQHHQHPQFMPPGIPGHPPPPPHAFAPIPPPPRLANGMEIPLPPSAEAESEAKRQLLMKREEEEAAKDRSLAELLGMLDGYRPVIPEEVADYYLQKSGFESQDPRLNRLLSISAEKFISDIVSDAYQYARIRTNASSGRPPAATSAANAANAASSSSTTNNAPYDRSRTVLTMDDLSSALGEYGINAKRADSYR
ncbi:unnamed protein product [Sympodiomycopsis kandeliae]